MAEVTGKIHKDGVLLYYPSVVVQMRLRFSAPDEAVILRKNAPRGQGDKPNNVQFQPLFAEGYQYDELTYVTNIIPRKADINLTGHRQASQFTLEFDYKDLPIDPRVITAAGVVIGMGLVPPEDFSAGMSLFASPEQRRRALFDPFRKTPGRRLYDGDTQPFGIGTFHDDDGTEHDVRAYVNAAEIKTSMIGAIDDWRVTHSDNGSVLKISGRGPIGLLLDSPFLPSNIEKLDLKQPIDDVVRQILSYHPQGTWFEQNVIIAPEFCWPDNKIPDVAFSEQVPEYRKSSRGKKRKKKSKKQAAEMSYWDLITQYCFLVGAIPRFIRNKLFIDSSRSLYDQVFRKRISVLATDKKSIYYNPNLRALFSPRTLVYGRNIDKLEFRKKYAGKKAKYVRVVGVDTKRAGRNKIVQAIYPDDSDLAKMDLSKLPGEMALTDIDKKDPKAKLKREKERYDKALVIPVNGITDKRTLKDIAKSIFEEIMRGEIGGSVQTRNLSTFDIDFQGAVGMLGDLLYMQTGDAIQLLADITNIKSSTPQVRSAWNDLISMEFNEALQTLTERIGDKKLAQAILVSTRLDTTLQTYFYVNNINYKFDAESGITVDIDFTNYVEARLKDDQGKFATEEYLKNRAEEKKRRARRKGRRKRRNTGGFSGSMATTSVDPYGISDDPGMSRIDQESANPLPQQTFDEIRLQAAEDAAIGPEGLAAMGVMPTPSAPALIEQGPPLVGDNLPGPAPTD